jgi:arsenical pump membrane protein
VILTTPNLCIWLIAACATAGVLIRPFKWPEAVWAVLGAVLLLVFQLLSWGSGLRALGKGLDVYLFLIGMMLLSETARREGLFDWVAAFAVNNAGGSPAQTTISAPLWRGHRRDGSAIERRGCCCANASRLRRDQEGEGRSPAISFHLRLHRQRRQLRPPDLQSGQPRALRRSHPPLGQWLASFALPSALAVLTTYVTLRWSQRAALTDACERDVDHPPLSRGGWAALAGIGLTAVILLAVSALNIQLGAPTCVLGLLTAGVVMVQKRETSWATLKGVSWSVLPLVAGLFILVEALDRSGLTGAVAAGMQSVVKASADGAAAGSGVTLALVSNAVNNLPAGLIASTAIAQAHPPQKAVDALLIGVDLGPNLSVTGSLATILWLTAIRREGEGVSFGKFLRVGALVMPPALILALLGRLLLA